MNLRPWSSVIFKNWFSTSRNVTRRGWDQGIKAVSTQTAVFPSMMPFGQVNILEGETRSSSVSTLKMETVYSSHGWGNFLFRLFGVIWQMTVDSNLNEPLSQILPICGIILKFVIQMVRQPITPFNVRDLLRCFDVSSQTASSVTSQMRDNDPRYVCLLPIRLTLQYVSIFTDHLDLIALKYLHHFRPNIEKKSP
jgi:hypothetical protein